MKTRSTTMPKDQAAFNMTGEQQKIFEQLVTLLHPYSTKLHNRVNTLTRYELWTRHYFRSQSMNPRNKRGFLFAGVMMLRDNVALYFFPLYLDPVLHAKIDETIRPVWKEGSAFRITTRLSSAQMEKFGELFRHGWEHYLLNRWVDQ